MTRISSKLTFIVSFIFLLTLTSVFYADGGAREAEILEPISLHVTDGQTINLGTVGPGQTIYITANGKGIGKAGDEANWGILAVLSVPEGWKGFDSVSLARQMRATVKVDPLAEDGEYTSEFRLTECESKDEDCEFKQGLGNVTFFVKIKVSKDVLATAVPIKTIFTGVGQPARYEVVIENKGTASDVFEISSEGVPAWDFKKTVHVPAKGKLITFYEIVSNEEKSYTPTIQIKSLSSDQLLQKHEVKFTAESDIIGDIRALKNGVLVFPIILEPLYSLLGIISYLI